MIGDPTISEWLIRLTLAAFLSGLVGFEREARQKAAGLRTHMLIGLGAALFTLISGAAFQFGDPTRIAAQVVSGVGFLGAGAIFREGANVRGLTTAAGIWAVAAIGMTAGAGLLVGATLATAIALTILSGLKLLERIMRQRAAVERLRPLGIRLSDLSQVSDLVKVIRSLDPSATDVVLRGLEGSRFQAIVEVDVDRLQTVRAGVSSLDTVEDSNEMDPV